MRNYFKKMNFHLNYKHSFFLFGIVFSIPLIIIAILIRVIIVGPIQNRFIDQHNDAAIAQIKYIDQQLNQVELFVSNIGYSVSNSTTLLDNALSFNSSAINSLSQQLFFMSNSSPLIKSTQLTFLSDDPFIITPAGSSSIYKNKSNTYLITNGKEFQWRISQSGKYVLLQKLIANQSNTPIYLSATLNNEQLLDLLSISAIAKGGSSFLITNNRTVTNTGVKIPEKMLRTIPNGESTFTFHRIKYLCTKKKISRVFDNWMVVTMVPFNTVVDPIVYFSNILVIVSILLIIITFVIGIIISRYEYKPLKEIMNTFFEPKDWQGKNEFQYLMSEWRLMSDEQIALKDISNQYQVKVRQSIFQGIIAGDITQTEPEIRQKLASSGWNNFSDNYFLVKLQITEQLNSNTSTQSELETLSSFMLENIIDDNTKKIFIHYTIITMQRSSAIIIFFVDNNSKRSIDNYFQTIVSGVNTILKHYLTITILENNNQLIKLPTFTAMLNSYSRQQKLISENQLIEINNTLSITSESTNHLLYPTNLENKIIALLKQNDTNKQSFLTAISFFVDTIIERDNHQDFLLRNTRRLCDSINHFLISNDISIASLPRTSFIQGQIEARLNILAIKTIILDSLILPAQQLLSENKKHVIVDKINQVISILQKNYSNPDVSLEYCAEKVTLDPPILSKEFKHYVGNNFIDYLTDLRIDTAKSLLANDSYRINEIADMVGYNDSYFNRLFKKKTGMTPGQYRKSLNRQADSKNGESHHE